MIHSTPNMLPIISFFEPITETSISKSICSTFLQFWHSVVPLELFLPFHPLNRCLVFLFRGDKHFKIIASLICARGSEHCDQFPNE